MILINGRNYFNEESFNEMCKKLEEGKHIDVMIDCIGHTRNANEQLAYREAFEEKYGGNVEIKGSADYRFNYKLKIELQKIIENEDSILYYANGNLGFEIHFDDDRKFNGNIIYCENIGSDNEEWKPVTDKEIYSFIKKRGLSDYKNKFEEE